MDTSVEKKEAGWLNKYKASIDLDPFFQREGVWRDKKQKYFIDSLIKNWGTPKIFLLQTGEETYDCLDGKQRLTSLFRFMANELPLLGEYTTGFDGKKYSQLPRSMQDKFDKYIFSVEIITNATPDEVVELYKRLQGGVALNFGEKLYPIPGNLNDFVKNTLVKRNFFKKNASLSNTRYSHHAVCAQLCLLSIKGAKEDLKLKFLEKLFKDYASFNEQGSEAGKIMEIFDYLEKAFTSSKDPAIRNRPNIISIFYLFLDLSARGDISGKEMAIGNFFRRFVNSVQKEMDKKPENADPELLRYQSAVTQGADKMKSINIRHEVLLKKLSLENNFFYRLIYPMSPQDKFMKYYDLAQRKLGLSTVIAFDDWLIKNMGLSDIECSSSRHRRPETFIGHIRNCIHHGTHGTFAKKDLPAAIKVLEKIFS